MSKSVVPAAAVAHAKQLVRNKKLTKRASSQNEAQAQAAVDHKDDSANVAKAQDVEQQLLSMADGSLGGFSFTNALSSAASSAASLAAESGAQSDSGRDDDDDGSGTLLLIAAIGLVGAGIAVLAAGGGEKNKAPTVAAATQAITTNEDTAIAVTVAATDANRKDVLSYSVTTAPTKGAVSGGTNGAFTYTPAANANGADSFVVTVNDGKGGTVTQTVNVTITAVNDAPTIAIATQNLTGTEDVNVTGQTVAADIDNAALTYTVDGKAANGTVTVGTDGKFTYVPNANFNGADKFTIKASDGTLSATQTVNVTLAAVNDAPTVSVAKQDLTIAEDTTLSGSVTAADVDGDKLTYAIGTKAANGTVTLAADGKFTYAPSADYNGSDTFTVVVSDGTLSVTQTINVAVTAVNDAPTVSPASQALTTDEDIAINGAMSASDIDSKALTYSVGTAAANGTVTIGTDGKFTYTPQADFNGTDSFVLSASDGDKAVTQAVSVKINAVNDAPAVAPASQALTTNEDTAVSGALAATDVDSAALTYAVGTKAANGAVAIGADGKFSYTPNANFNGNDTFTLTVSDGDKTTSQAVSVAIAAVNDAPTISAAPSKLDVNSGATVSFSVTASDLDGDKLTTTTTVPGKGGVAANVDGTFTYTPIAGFSGSDTFQIKVSDGTASVTQDVTVNVISTVNTFSIDIGQPSSDPTAVAAGTGKFVFTDDATKNTNVIIQSFTKDDAITVSGAAAGLYNFGTVNDTDLQITFNTNNANNIIILDNVVTSGALVFDLGSANTAIRTFLGADASYNFITFG